MSSFLDALNIISYFVEPRLFRASPYIKEVTWSSTGNIKSVSIKDNNKTKSNKTKGSFTITDPGLHEIEWDVKADGAGKFFIFLDGIKKATFDSAIQIPEKYEAPCVTYSISSAGEQCDPNHKKVNRVRSRWTYTDKRMVRRSGRGSGRYYLRTIDQKTQWRNRSTPLPSDAPRSRPGAPSRTYTQIANIVPQIQDRYTCVAQSGCTKTKTRMVPSHIKNKDGDFKLFIQSVPSEVDPPKTKRDIERLEKDIKKIRERDKQILDLLQRGVKTRKEFVSIPDIPIDTELSRYRIITPETFQKVGEKVVPRIRYESVRELLPEAVANFLFRGYEIQQVAFGTPLSLSKPFGKSVIARSKELASGLGKVIIEPVRIGGRITWKDIQVDRVIPTVQPQREGGVIHRQHFKRRIVIV